MTASASLSPDEIQMLRERPVIVEIHRRRLVAILRGLPAQAAVQVALALARGGVPVIEITLDREDAAEAISQLAGRDDLFVGAGSARTPDDADRAIAAGAAFVVSPAALGDVVERCHRHQVPAIPGALTPTEIETAWGWGSALVKLFPAGPLGASYLRHLRGPLPDVPLLVTGGIAATDAAPFLAAGAVAVGIGSSLLPTGAVAAEDWPSIERAARESVAALHGCPAGDSRSSIEGDTR